MTGEQGRFLVLDGIDGCGKSTQARLLVQRLRDQGGDPLHLREPGSTIAGERIRALLLDERTPLGVAAETLLFAAARRQMLDELVGPALMAGRDVVCERFHPATFAYQAVAGKLEEETVLELLFAWAGAPAPDRVVVLDLDVETAAGRAEGEDRFESRGLPFQRAVAEGFLRYARRVPGVAVVGAGGSPDEVAARVWEEVRRAN